MGTYSILYAGEKKEYHSVFVEFAADWDWKVKAKWARSEKEGPGGKWFSMPGLDKKAYRALLRHFGLEKWPNEFPLEKVISMSPKELAAVRRKKEVIHKLERKKIASDTLGYHISADKG